MAGTLKRTKNVTITVHINILLISTPLKTQTVLWQHIYIGFSYRVYWMGVSNWTFYGIDYVYDQFRFDY